MCEELDAVSGGEGNVGERGGGLGGPLELGGRAEVHGAGGVEEEVDVEVLFLDEELEEEALETSVSVPVEVPEVVAGDVGAEVGELDGGAAAGGAALALGAADHDVLGDDGGLLELAEELGREQVAIARGGLGVGHRRITRGGPGWTWR